MSRNASDPLQLMADDVAGWLGTCVPGGEVDLVGHSLGGLVACLAAIRVPARVRRLALEGVGLLEPRPADPPVKPGGVLSLDWQVVEQVRPEIDNFDPSWSDVAAAIEALTLVIAGGKTSPVPHAQIEDLDHHLRDGQMVTINAGHPVYTTRPLEFTTQLLSFLG